LETEICGQRFSTARPANGPRRRWNRLGRLATESWPKSNTAAVASEPVLSLCRVITASLGSEKRPGWVDEFTDQPLARRTYLRLSTRENVRTIIFDRSKVMMAHQEVRANRRDFLRHRIARDFRSLPAASVGLLSASRHPCDIVSMTTLYPLEDLRLVMLEHSKQRFSFSPVDPLERGDACGANPAT
jgi:hypothetical protein